MLQDLLFMTYRINTILNYFILTFVTSQECNVLSISAALHSADRTGVGLHQQGKHKDIHARQKQNELWLSCDITKEVSVMSGGLW